MNSTLRDPSDSAGRNSCQLGVPVRPGIFLLLTSLTEPFEEIRIYFKVNGSS